MKIVQYLFIASCIATFQSTQPILWENVDYKTFDAYVTKAYTKLNAVHDQLQFENHGPRDIIWTGKVFADALYPQQKAALKILIEELKIVDSHNDNLHAIPLAEFFNHQVYNPWKQEFKHKYEDSIKSNDTHAWGWVHQPTMAPIDE